jgi:hypothetical protein
MLNYCAGCFNAPGQKRFRIVVAGAPNSASGRAFFDDPPSLKPLLSAAWRYQTLSRPSRQIAAQANMSTLATGAVVGMFVERHTSGRWGAGR